MTRKVHGSRQASEELEAVVRDYYIKSLLSYSELARQSEALFGQKLPNQTLRNWSFKTSPNWEVQRQHYQDSLGGTGDLSLREQVDNVRGFLYQAIEAAAKGGFFITFNPYEVDASEIRRLVEGALKDRPGVRVKTGGPLEAAIVNAWLGLLTKTGADLSLGESAQTDLETVQAETLRALNALQETNGTS